MYFFLTIMKMLILRTTARTYVHIYELRSHLTTLTRHENKQIYINNTHNLSKLLVNTYLVSCTST